MAQMWKPVKRVADSALGAFGPGTFGRRAEAFASVFGTPGFLMGQTLFVLAWIAVNGVAVAYRWDPYPFILLNLMFSLQAAYAAPLILLAQTRQAEREKLFNDSDQAQREAIAKATLTNQQEVLAILRQLLDKVDGDTEVTRQIPPSQDEDSA